MRKFYTP